MKTILIHGGDTDPTSRAIVDKLPGWVTQSINHFTTPHPYLIRAVPTLLFLTDDGSQMVAEPLDEQFTLEDAAAVAKGAKKATAIGDAPLAPLAIDPLPEPSRPDEQANDADATALLQDITNNGSKYTLDQSNAALVSLAEVVARLVRLRGVPS